MSDLLEKYGIGRDASVSVDKMPSDFDYLRDLPLDLVIGIEIYRRRGSLPTEFDQTRRGRLTLGEGGSGGIAGATVLIWTFIP